MFKIDRQRIAFSAVLIALTMAPGYTAAQTRAKTPIDSIVALVEEDVILRSELDVAMAGIIERVRATGEAMPPMHLLERQVLERLIIRELQVQRALQTGIRVSDADIDQALTQLADELFEIRMKSAYEDLENPMRIRQLKRDIAKLRTVKRERELVAAREAKEK